MAFSRKRGDLQDQSRPTPQTSVSMRLAKYQNPSSQMLQTQQQMPQLVQNPQMSPSYQQAYQQSYITAQMQTSQINYTPNRPEKRGAADRATTTSPTLLVGSTHSAVVSHVQDGPFSFSIQLQTSIDEVLPSITSILNQYNPVPISSPLLPGNNVMGRCLETSELRRCCVVNVLATSCSVYYIDYGNSEELPYSHIFQLPTYALEIAPSLALRFSLSELSDITINDQTKDYFVKLVLNKMIHLKVTEREGPMYHYCEMYYDGQNVRDMLINVNSPLEYTNQFPPRGREMSVSVSYVDSPSQFFVQYTSEFSILGQIKEAMAYVGTSQSRFKNLDDVNIGVPVASYFQQDNTWYRALVVGVDGSKVNVFFVDYGSRDNVDISQLTVITRQIVKKWRSQAVECCLSGFENSSPDPVISSLMEEMTLGKRFTLKLRSMLNGNRLSVDLINDQGHNINKILSAKAESRAEELAKHSISIPKTNSKREIFSSGHSNDTGDKWGKRQDFDRSYNEHDDRCNDDDKTVYYKRNENKDRKPRHDGSGSESGRSTGKFRSDKPRYNERPSQEDKTERRFKDRFDKPQTDRPRNDRNNDGFDRNERFNRNENRFDKSDNRNRTHQDRKRFDKSDDLDKKRFDKPRNNYTRRSYGDDFNTSINSSNEMKVESWEDPVVAQSPPSSVEQIITSFNKLNILEGQTIEAHFSSMNDPSDIYVQLTGSEGPLEQVRQLIESDLVNIPNRKIPPSDIVITMPVLAVYPDDNLIYRAMVKTFPDSSNQVSVIYVDYGNSSVVPVSSVFMVSKELSSTPAQALRIKLNNVSPPLSGWPSDIDPYQNVYESCDILSINVSKVKFIDGELLVTGTISKELSQQLAECSLVAELNEVQLEQPEQVIPVPVQPVAQVEPIAQVQPVEQEPNPEVSDKWSGKLSWLIGQYLTATIINKINESIFTIDIDDIGIVHAEIKNGKTTKTPEKVVVYVHSVGDDRIFVDFYKIDGTSLTGGCDKCPIWPMKVLQKKFKGFISHFEDDIIYIQKSDDSHVIADLLDDLYAKYKNTEAEEITWKKDMACCCLSSDENWYRSKIIDGTEFTVSFVDYGNKETVTKDKLRKIDILMPEFCFKIKLPGEYKADFSCYTSEEFNVQVYKFENDVFISDLFFQNGESLMDKINGKYNLDLPLDYDFEVGQTIDMTISHVDSPTMFWVQLNKDLEKIDELQESLKTQEEGESNKVFAALYSLDNNWYRAIDIGDGMVRFIDYGNCDKPDKRKHLSPEYIKPEKGYATQFYLCVKPEGEWCMEASKFFEDFIENPIEAKIISMRYKTVVDLISGGKSVSDILIKKGYGTYTDCCPDLNIEPTESPEIKQLPINPKINDTTVQKVFIAYLGSVVNFYIQYGEQTKDLEQICGHLLKASKFKTKDVNIGDLVAARFPEDTLWYRARIVSKDPIKAIFIDYGNTSEVSEVRELPDELYEMPAFAVHCSLNIDDIDEYNDRFFEILDSGETAYEVEYLTKGCPNVVSLKFFGGDNILSKIIPEENHKDKVLQEENHKDKVLQEENHKDKVLQEENHKDKVLQEENHKDKVLQEENHKDKVLQEDNHKDSVLQEENHKEVKVLQEENHKEVKVLQEENHKEVKVLQEENHKEVKVLQEENHKEVKVLQEENHAKVLPEEECVQEILPEDSAQDLSCESSALAQDLSKESSALAQDLSEESTLENLSPEKTTKVSPSKPTYLASYKSCTITHFESLDSFFLQTPEQLEMLINFIENVIPDELPDVTDLKLNDIVLVKYPKDNGWCRARVIKLPNTFFLIDYGNKCQSNEVKQINDYMPACCFETELIKQQKESKWSQEALDKFNSLVDLDISFDVYIYEMPENKPKVVDMYLGGNSLSEELTKLTNKIGLVVRKCRVCFYESLNKFFIMDEKNKNDMSLIDKELQSSIAINKPVKIGDLIAAFYPKHHIWYRSLVLQTDPLRVFFIDFGGEAEVDQISSLPDAISSMPPMCTQMRVNRSDGSPWPEETFAIGGNVLTNHQITVYETVLNGIKKINIDIDHFGDASVFFEQFVHGNQPKSPERMVPGCVSGNNVPNQNN